VDSFRPAALLPFGLLLTMYAWGADPPPEFTAARVSRGGITVKILVPGVRMSIQGRNLGPPGTGCYGSADPQRRETLNPRRLDKRFVDILIFPTELCGVQVFIGDKAAGLMYVSGGQIDFKIPQDSPESGSADLRVVYLGQSSAPVTMEAGFGKTTISLAQPAYTDMPVWMKVEFSDDSGMIEYPYDQGPAGFGCNEVEVRKDGKLLPQNPDSDWLQRYGSSGSGPICGGGNYARASNHMGRLPLHLLYRFDVPGTYEVRLTVWSRPAEFGQRGEMWARSEWTPIDVLPSKPHRRAEWLENLRMRAPVDAAEFLSDALPGVLGIPDDVSFEILTGYLYHPNVFVRRQAMYGLSYWPDDFASKRLLVLLHTKGPSDAPIEFLARQPKFCAAHPAETVEATLPFLERGARALDPQSRRYLGFIVAATKDGRAHTLVRTLLDDGDDDMLYPLVSFGDPADLPGLSAILANPTGPGAYLPEQLYRSFGDAAVPYLERTLSGSPGMTAAQNIARQLMAIGDPAGFQFAARSIERKDASRAAMIRALMGQFPELKPASDDAIAAFARKRAGPAQ
jgi:hypothetical protein